MICHLIKVLYIFIYLYSTKLSLDVLTKSPPHPEGSSRATGGTLRGQASGQGYNPVDDEDLQSFSIIGKVKGITLLYLSALDPAQLAINNMKPSMKVSVTINTNLGPVLKEIAKLWPPITCK